MYEFSAKQNTTYCKIDEQISCANEQKQSRRTNFCPSALLIINDLYSLLRAKMNQYSSSSKKKSSLLG